MTSVIRRACAGVVALALIVVLPLSGIIPGRSALAADAGSKVSLAINCTGNPESITITNNTSKTITIRTITTVYQPRSNEPFTVTSTLGAGASKTYKAGPAATGSRVLTKQYIFDNGAGDKEGVRVATSVGNKAKYCPKKSSGSTQPTPKPTPRPSNPSCDPNYSGACIPVYPPDIDCGDISAKNFKSIGSDPHRLDRDNDGIACES